MKSSVPRQFSTNLFKYSVVSVLKKNNPAAGLKLLILKIVEHTYIYFYNECC